MDGSLLGEDLDGILAALPASSLDYQEWVGVGMALKAEGYGCEVWDAWSAADAARYHAGECERKWRSFGDGGEGRVNGGTLVQMAMERGYEPPGWGDDEAFGWDLSEADPWDGPGAPGGREWRTTRPQQQGQAKPANVVVDPTWLEGEELREPEGDAWHPADQLTRYLSALFDPEDIVGYVTAAFERDGRWTPAGKGDCTRTAGEIIQQLAKYGDDLSYTLGQPNAEAGAWIRFNPLDGQGVRNDNVAEFRYALVESDEMAPGRQMAVMRALELPIAAVVHSGNKSVHAIVRVDAKDYDEYRKRVDFLYRTCADNGLKLDTQNKNPSRLSRMPGVERAGRKQWLVAESMGRASWKDWREWLDEQNDDLPDPETLDRTWDDMPELAPPLIEGVLRQGHKMLLAGPSKAGKSFALIALTVAIAEGLEWFGWRCAQGRVMYVNLELDRASCLHRFRDVYAAMGARPDNLANVAVWNLRGKSKPMDQLAPALIRRAAKERPIAVIIDPIYKVITGDENSADQMAAFCNQFDKVADGLGCAVIYCHHHSKGAQGGKRSMDRASGSGVFARDPDALLDMLELHVSDELRAQLEARAVGQQAAGFMDANAARLGGGWRAEVPEDDLAAGGDKLMAACRSIVQARAPEWTKAYLDGILAARGRAKAMSAWRVEGTLREFPRFEPVDLLFDYPMHAVDRTGLLADASPEGEEMGRMDYRAQGRERKARNDAKKQEEKLAALREGMAACAEDGVDATVANVVERMPEVSGKQVTKATVQNWVKADKNEWCTIVSEGGRGKPGVLRDPEMEDMLNGW
ncbi:AAA family ATPase [Eggerthella lenta]|uniref:AAA family ATPase n=1 Tax=Eggerthella lenta TaxID=84112 RepID=UPI000DF67D6D|nr:AAA family ATPase [Eggerthella lenta]RDB76403.1 DNA primase [Eggerthella lenta]